MHIFIPGVMLLAKTDEALLNLRSYFKERRVIKRYWVITKGIPNPREGVIDIPIVETEVSLFCHLINIFNLLAQNFP